MVGKDVSAMGNEELLSAYRDAAVETVTAAFLKTTISHDSSPDDMRAELLRRLSANVIPPGPGPNEIRLHWESLLRFLDSRCKHMSVCPWPSVEALRQFFPVADPSAPRWYTKEEMHDALIGRNYEPKIADELAGWFADLLQGAYGKGKSHAAPVAPLDEKRLAEIRERAEKAHQMVIDLCKKKGQKGSREWMMSIPARPDYDPDIVIFNSLRDIPYLLEQIESLRRSGAQKEHK